MANILIRSIFSVLSNASKIHFPFSIPLKDSIKKNNNNLQDISLAIRSFEYGEHDEYDVNIPRGVR